MALRHAASPASSVRLAALRSRGALVLTVVAAFAAAVIAWRRRQPRRKLPPPSRPLVHDVRVKEISDQAGWAYQLHVPEVLRTTPKFKGAVLDNENALCPDGIVMWHCSPLSNFLACTVTIMFQGEKFEFKSSEALIMACKEKLLMPQVSFKEVLRKQACCGSAEESKSLTAAATQSARDYRWWSDHGAHLLTGILACWPKFSQDAGLCRFLQSTKPSMLIETSPNDGSWGVAMNSSEFLERKMDARNFALSSTSTEKLSFAVGRKTITREFQHANALGKALLVVRELTAPGATPLPECPQMMDVFVRAGLFLEDMKDLAVDWRPAYEHLKKVLQEEPAPAERAVAEAAAPAVPAAPDSSAAAAPADSAAASTEAAAQPAAAAAPAAPAVTESEPPPVAEAAAAPSAEPATADVEAAAASAVVEASGPEPEPASAQEDEAALAVPAETAAEPEEEEPAAAPATPEAVEAEAEPAAAEASDAVATHHDEAAPAVAESAQEAAGAAAADAEVEEPAAEPSDAECATPQQDEASADPPPVPSLPVTEEAFWSLRTVKEPAADDFHDANQDASPAEATIDDFHDAITEQEASPAQAISSLDAAGTAEEQIVAEPADANHAPEAASEASPSLEPTSPAEAPADASQLPDAATEEAQDDADKKKPRRKRHRKPKS